VVIPLAVGSEIAGYRIESILGRGGMGVVYEARQLSLGRVVALKVVTPLRSEDAGFRERFRREGMAQAAIDHPHIVTVYEAGAADDQLYIAMRLIRGDTLKHALRDGPLEPSRAVRLLAPIADALDAAHAAGLVHRDVKPQNILVGPGDHPYLADFGLTKVTGQTSLTATGLFMGTPDYTPPEVAEGGEATAASDVYAFAAVAYECLSGGPPFPRPTQAGVLYAHVHEPPPRASERRPGLPLAVDAALARGLEKDPAQRPATARALIDGVTAAVGSADADPSDTAPTDVAAPLVRQPTTLVAEGATLRASSPTPAAKAPEAVTPRRSARTLAAGVAVLVAAAVAVVLLASTGDDGDRQRAGGEPGAGSVVLGSSLEAASAGVGECGGNPDDPRPPCTLLQTALPARRLRVPFDGIISRWRVRGASGTIALAVLRGSDQPRRVAVTRREHMPTTGRHEFRTDLRVRKGDRVALQLAGGASFGYAGVPAARLARWSPQVTSARPPDYTEPDGLELLYAVDVAPDS